MNRHPISLLCLLACVAGLHAQNPELTWPPTLPGGKKVATGTSPMLLKGTATLQEGVAVAKAAPTIDFMYYPCQTYYEPKGMLWSAWGDSFAAGDKCWSAIGDHTGPGGNAFLHEYDATTKELKTVVDVKKLLNLPAGHYTPGKIHSSPALAKDGWIYFSTHRGSTAVTVPANHYKGDWILRYHPETGKSEIVAHAPLANQCLPTGWLDPERMIFYSGTQDGNYKAKLPASFLAYDLNSRKVIYSDKAGPHRALILARSTGRVYFNRGSEEELVRFDPAKPGAPEPIGVKLSMRATSAETADGIVYTADADGIQAFNTKTEKAEKLGPSTVGVNGYITSLSICPKTGRYLYYIPGAHGGAEKDGTPVVQFDVKTKQRKVIAFLHPYCFEEYHYVPAGTYGTALSPDGDKLYVTWNGARNVKKEDFAKPNWKAKWDTCAFTVIHIPESERKP